MKKKIVFVSERGAQYDNEHAAGLDDQKFAIENKLKEINEYSDGIDHFIELVSAQLMEKRSSLSELINNFTPKTS